MSPEELCRRETRFAMVAQAYQKMTSAQRKALVLSASDIAEMKPHALYLLTTYRTMTVAQQGRVLALVAQLAGAPHGSEPTHTDRARRPAKVLRLVLNRQGGAR